MKGFKIIDKYQVDYKNMLGQGGMAKVYLGYYGTNMGDPQARFAVKQISIHSSLVVTDSILQEINLLRKLNHPFILKYIDAKKSPQCLFLILQFCNEGTLEDLILKESLGQQQIKKLLAQMVIALNFLKGQKIIHRDIKPKNILLHNGVVKISDFGVAKMITEHNEDKEVTSFSGTYPFMSPQVLRQYKYTYQTDIWSLGVTLYFMIFKQLPWKGNNVVQILKEIEQEGIVIPEANISNQLKEILIKMLMYEEQQRITIEALKKHPYLIKEIEEIQREYHKQFYQDTVAQPKEITKNEFVIDNQQPGEKLQIQCIRRSLQVNESFRASKKKNQLAEFAFSKLSNYKNHIVFFEETLDNLRNYFKKKDIIEEELFRKCEFLLVKRCYIVSNDLHKMLSFGTHTEGNILIPKEQFKELMDEKKSKTLNMRSLRETVVRLYEKFKNQWLTTKQVFYSFQRNHGITAKNRFEAYTESLIESPNLILAFNDCYMELFLKFSKGIVETYSKRLSQPINMSNIVINFGVSITFIYDIMIILCYPNLAQTGNMKAYMDKKKHTRCQQFIYRICLAYKKWIKEQQ